MICMHLTLFIDALCLSYLKKQLLFTDYRRASVSNWMNVQQKAAAEAPIGYIQIIAGPGTGKTVTMVGRILELIKRGIEPHRIVAMTFTRAAATSLKQRVSQALGGEPAGIMIGTFHSLALLMMRKYGEMQRLNLRILGDHDALSICREIAPEMKPRTLLKYFNLLRKSPSQLEKELSRTSGDIDSEAEIKRIRQLYQNYKVRQHALNFYDFDEILDLFEAFLCRTRAETVDKDVGAVLVDEFQDTCESQLRIALHLAASSRNLTVVGDPKQSIYAFRGAVPGIFRAMKEQEGIEVKELPLQINYRSTQPILDLAQRVLMPRTSPLVRMGFRKLDFKNLTATAGEARPTESGKLKAVTTKDLELPVQIVRLKSNKSEASVVAGYIRKLLDIGVKPRDICVLSASSRAFMSFESAFMTRSIGVRMVGGRQLLRSGAITVFIDYLRVAMDASDSLALKRTINLPARGIGAKTLEALIEDSSSEQGLTLDYLRKRDDVKGVSDYVSHINAISVLLHTAEGSDPALLQKENVVAALNYMGSKLFPDVDIKPLLSAVTIFAEEFASISNEDNTAFAQYFVNLWALNPDSTVSDSGAEESKVTCSTIHSAKGLEWPVVFVLGVNRDGFSSYSSHEDDDEDTKNTKDEDEIRRLIFVALTRAKRFLAITLESTENEALLNLHSSQKILPYFQPINALVVRSLQSCLDYELDLSLCQKTPAQSGQFFGFRSGLDIYREEKANPRIAGTGKKNLSSKSGSFAEFPTGLNSQRPLTVSAKKRPSEQEGALFTGFRTGLDIYKEEKDQPRHTTAENPVRPGQDSSAFRTGLDIYKEEKENPKPWYAQKQATRPQSARPTKRAGSSGDSKKARKLSNQHSIKSFFG